MAPMGRRKTISDEQLLAAARAAFEECGPAASTREIARRANISEGVIFQRFGTKTELFFAAMVPPAFDLGPEPSKKGTPAEARRRLESLVTRLIEYFRRTVPVLGPLMTQSEFRFEEFARRNPQSSLVVLREDLARRLSEEQRLGNLGPGPVGPMALLLISLGHSLAVFERLGAHDSHFSKAFIQGTVACLWGGLGPEEKKNAGRKR
jgi:AcrR family transcriptional regulator